MASSRKKGFTLIELLVVISIIAMLLGMLMPALTRAKQAAQLVLCSSNHKTLVTAWKIYSADNDSKLVDGHTQRGGNLHDNQHHWVEPPVDDAGNYAGGDASTPTLLQHELNGIEAGTLFPYVEEVEAYRCSSDRRNKGVGGQPSSFRTYSLTANMNGEKNYRTEEITAVREGQITEPDARFVFIDDFDNRSYNMGSWIFRYDLTNPNNHKIADAVSVWHFKKCNFSYADGHVEPYSWKDTRTHKYSLLRAFNEENLNYSQMMAERDAACSNNEDVQFLARGYRAR